jgi:hypothetical protein
MKRTCPTCGKNRRLDKKYYNNKSRTNGKQVECKDCQSDRNNRLKQTERYKIFKRKRDRKWKQENRDKVKNYNAEYYKKYKERIMSRRNTESILIIDNGDKKKINTSRPIRKKYPDDIVINPQRKLNG